MLRKLFFFFSVIFFLPMMSFAASEPLQILEAQDVNQYSSQGMNFNNSGPVDVIVLHFNPTKLSTGSYGVKVHNILAINQDSLIYTAWHAYIEKLQALGVNTPVTVFYNVGFPAYQAAYQFVALPPMWTISYDDNSRYNEQDILAWYKDLASDLKSYIVLDKIHKQLNFYEQPIKK